MVLSEANGFGARLLLPFWNTSPKLVHNELLDVWGQERAVGASFSGPSNQGLLLAVERNPTSRTTKTMFKSAETLDPSQ